ncbi:MAG TPA: hypothetical protein VFC19_30060 [Candidatus Limnocylindrales bacterium]|nr:hypothetical protein [Candidatus Limnocylindrales bacterium]
MTISPTVKVGILLPRRPGDLGEWLADAAAFDAAGADALWIDVQAGVGLDVMALAAALAATTSKAALIARMPEGTAAEAVSTLRRLSRGRYVPADEAGRWVRMPVPDSRAHWHRTLADVEAEGVSTGILVEADSRLLDLLRNPGDPGERHDLELAQG